MPYSAQVYKVMIASPSDVAQERSIVRDLIHEWNSVNSEDRGIVLMPVGWETHSSPSMEARAQEVVNKQVLADCDLLVAVLWTRIGTPTGKSRSGTVEEIEEHLAKGKPTMIYFSSAPVRPDSVDEKQYSALREFRDDLKSRGLIETYESPGEFREKFARQLAQTVIRQFTTENTSDQILTQGQDSYASGTQSPALLDEAKDLLVTAATTGSGQIMRIRVARGLTIQAGSRNFVDMGNPRSEARWERALEELVDLDLIRDQGYKGEVYRLTAHGYDVVDKLALESS